MIFINIVDKDMHKIKVPSYIRVDAYCKSAKSPAFGYEYFNIENIFFMNLIGTFSD